MLLYTGYRTLFAYSGTANESTPSVAYANRLGTGKPVDRQAAVRNNDIPPTEHYSASGKGVNGDIRLLSRCVSRQSVRFCGDPCFFSFRT